MNSASSLDAAMVAMHAGFGNAGLSRKLGVTHMLIVAATAIFDLDVSDSSI